MSFKHILCKSYCYSGIANSFLNHIISIVGKIRWCICHDSISAFNIKLRMENSMLSGLLTLFCHFRHY